MPHFPISPRLVIHGGFFTPRGALTEHHLEQRIHEALATIVKQAYDVLSSVGARAAVLHGIRWLEDETLFNTCMSDSSQTDNHLRLSAALMDSANHRFAGVINIENIKNPIDVANLLTRESHSVLASEMATQYARQHGIPPYHPVTSPHPLWQDTHSLSKTRTVGAVAIDEEGILCAGTSTSGFGSEMSVGGTSASAYTSPVASVSCMGVGEHIINHGVAVKIVTRVQDGMLLQNAVDRTLQEARRLNYRFGLISLDNNGNIVIGKTVDDDDYSIAYASYDGQVLKAYP